MVITPGLQCLPLQVVQHSCTLVYCVRADVANMTIYFFLYENIIFGQYISVSEVTILRRYRNFITIVIILILLIIMTHNDRILWPERRQRLIVSIIHPCTDRLGFRTQGGGRSSLGPIALSRR